MDFYFGKVLSEARNSPNKDKQKLAFKYYEYHDNIMEQFYWDNDVTKLAAALERLRKSFLKRLSKLQGEEEEKVQVEEALTFTDEENEDTVAKTGSKRTSTSAGFNEGRPSTTAVPHSREPILATGITGKTIPAKGLLPYEQRWPVPTAARDPRFGTLASVMDVASYFGIPIFCIGVMTLLNTWIGDFLPVGKNREVVREMAQDFFMVIQGRFPDLDSAKEKILRILWKLYDEPKPKNGIETHSNFRTSFLFRSETSDVVVREISRKNGF